MNNQDFRTAPERAVPLEAEHLLRVSGPARLRAVRGHLWLTVDGQTDDHVLVPGDQFVLGADAGALVQAIFAPACVVVAEAAAQAWPERIERALRGATRRLALHRLWPATRRP